MGKGMPSLHSSLRASLLDKSTCTIHIKTWANANDWNVFLKLLYGFSSMYAFTCATSFCLIGLSKINYIRILLAPSFIRGPQPPHWSPMAKIALHDRGTRGVSMEFILLIVLCPTTTISRYFIPNTWVRVT